MTPLIIKKVLGQEVYELFEKYRNEPKPDRVIKLQTSPEGKKIFEEQLKKEYDRRR